MILSSCGYYEIKNESLKRPSFEYQKTYIVNRPVVEVIPTYFAWTTKYGTFSDPKDEATGTLFKAEKYPSFEKNNFTVEDVKAKTKFILKEENDQDYINYSISGKDNKFCEIKSFSRINFLKYDLTYKNAKYLFEGKINKFSEVIHSIVFTIKKEHVVLCYIFKQNYYFKNENEVIINKKSKDIDDMSYITFTIFIDQILKENKLQYK